jgi:hypothetical protein
MSRGSSQPTSEASGRDNVLEAVVEAHLGGAAPKTRRPDMDLRVVELAEPWGRWQAGTRGVIVDAFEDEAVVEIADGHGVTLDLLAAPYAVLAVHERTGCTR